MKLLFLTCQYPPPLGGGSRVYLHTLISSCSPSNIIVYTNARPGQEIFDPQEKYRIIRSHFNYFKNTKFDQLCMTIEWLITIIWFLRKEEIDLLNAGHLFNEGIVCWILGKLFNIPYIVFGYGEELNITLNRCDKYWGFLKKNIFKRLINDASGLISISDYTSSLFIAFGADPRKICKIVPAMSPLKFFVQNSFEEIKIKYNISDHQRIILSVGRLIERKGQSDLIKTMPRILSCFPNSILIIVGQGPEKENLQKLIDDLCLSKKVFLSGFIDDKELSNLYDFCDVFALPCKELDDGDTEGFGIVFLEANAHGKPVIGGNVGGIQDAIIDGKTGFIINGSKPDEIFNALEKLLSDPNLASKMGEFGRQRIIRELSPQKGADCFIDFCTKVIGKR